MQLLQHEYFFPVPVCSGHKSGSKMFQSKNEDQEKNAILTQIFQGTIGIEVWIRLKNPTRSRRNKFNHNSLPLLFSTQSKKYGLSSDLHQSTKWLTLGSRPNHFLEKTYPMGYNHFLCDQHQACEGQHGGLLGRQGNWNFLKCIWANHCKHKYALTKWYIYWNDGFSTEWLDDFSLSMTNSHFFKPPNHTPKNIYKMAFCLLQNGWPWCPKMIMPSKQKW